MNNLLTVLQNRHKVLGLNERYLGYIRPSNLSKAIRIADNKLLTKKVLKRHGIPTPETIAVIKDRRKLDSFNFDSLPKSFVVKPVHGSRGGGIEIFYNRDKEGRWIKANGERVTLDEFKALCLEILDGKFSLFNEPDTILIEERVVPHKNFKYYSYKGTPDIRIVVYKKVPLMSYARLPTKASNGKANLDLGAIGAGIDMAVGKTTSAIIGKSTPIENVPEYNIPLSGLRIPYWDKILSYAIQASIATGLKFGGFDFLIDKEKGPLLVELNARPGLSIQLSNEDGLSWRLNKIKGLKVKTPEQGVRLAKDLFGGEIEEEIETISGKRVIGLIETVKLYSLDGTKFEEVKAKIDTGADSTSIDKELAERLGYGDLINIEELQNFKFAENIEKRKQQEEELTALLGKKYNNLEEVQFVKSSHGMSIRPYVKLKMELDAYAFDTKVSIYDRSALEYKIIIGRKSLTNFLIDPSKK